MASAPLPEVVGVAAVMSRYGLRDRRAARRLMDEAGAFVVCGRLLIRREDLLAHEEALRVARHRVGDGAGAPRARPARPPGRSGSARPGSDPLPPGWWRATPGNRDAA